MRGSFSENEPYRLRSKEWDEYEGELTPDSEEGTEDKEEDISKTKKSYGYFKQDDFDEHHDKKVDLDQYHVQKEIGEERFPENRKVEKPPSQDQSKFPRSYLPTDSSSSKIANKEKKRHYWNSRS